MKKLYLLITAIIAAFPLSMAGHVAMNEFTTYTNMAVFPYKVYDLVEDADGFLWIATDSGLIRSDGEQFDRYTTTSDGKHRIPEILSLLIRNDKGSLLMGTTEGLFLYDMRKGTLLKSTMISNTRIRALEKFGDKLYIGTSQGLFRSEQPHQGAADRKEEFVRISSECFITSCCKIRDEIYFGSFDGLARLTEDGEQESLPLPVLEGNGRNTILDICPDPYHSDIIWLATIDGIIRYDVHDCSSMHFLKGNMIRSLAFCRNNMWVGSDNGLSIIDARNPAASSSDIRKNYASLPSASIYKIYENRRGDVFVGSDIGLSRLNSSEDWIKYNINSRKGPLSCCNCMVYDKDNLYIGTQEGILRVNRKDSGNYETIYPAPDEIRTKSRIRDLLLQEGMLWITSDNGVDCMDLKTGRINSLEFHFPDPGSQSSLTYSIQKDDEDKLWIASSRGIFVMKEDPEADDAALSGTDKRYRCRRLWKEHDITKICFFEDSAVAIGQGDVFVIDTRQLHTESRLSGYQIRTMTSYNDNIWFGGRNGLYRLRDYTRLIHIDGMLDDVDRICVNDGNIYTLSGSEINEYSPYEQQWKEFNLSDIPITCMSSYGLRKLFIGSLDCFYLLDIPSIFKIREKYPAPVLTVLTIDNQKIMPTVEYNGEVVLQEQLCYTERLVLPKGTNSFSLTFTVPDFKNQNTTFSYRLRGHSDEWNQTKNNQVIFSDIPAGNYIFELTSSLSDPEKPTALHLKVKPEWYQSSLMRMLSVILFTLLLWALVWYIRMRRQLALAEKEKTDAMKAAQGKKAFMETLSYEMTAPLTDIMDQLGKISSRPFCEINAEQLQVLNRNSERIQNLLHKMTEMNDSSDGELFIPSPTDLNVLLTEVWDEFKPRMTQKHIEATLYTERLNYLFMVDRLKIRTALENILDNALKFTPSGGRISCRLQKRDMEDNALMAEIIITDTGKGMSGESIALACNKYFTGKDAGTDAGAGLGLWIADQTARMHHGSLKLMSGKGKGCTVTFSIPTICNSSLAVYEEEENGIWKRFNIAWKHNRKATVLFISSESLFLEAMIEHLSEHINVLTASNPEECQQTARNNAVDLILYDFTSMDTTENLWTNVRDWCNDPIVPLIGITEESGDVPGYQLAVHCDRLLNKPVNQKQLTEGILWAILKHEKNLETMRKEQLTSPQEEMMEAPDNIFLKEMMSIIEKNIDNPDFNVEKLCSSSHYSSSQIYRNIKQICGMTVVEFIRDVRLKKAASLIRQGKLTINEIMYMAGFTSRAYFFRRFKEKFGMAPSEYRAKFDTESED